MEIHVLASGSTGNATYIRMGDTRLLVDAGISARRIKLGLAEVGVAPENLDGIFITHEHRDHVAGLVTLLKKYRLPLYTRPATWESMYCRDQLPAECFRPLELSLEIGSVIAEAFSISHDAADPVGFSFCRRDMKCCVATDMGFITESVKKALAHSDVLVLESNHDVDMLNNGEYPWYLKKRILSNRGHLANTDTGWMLARLPKKQRTEVFLAHLSKENNRPELARATVQNILNEHDCRQAASITLHLTHPDRRAGWIRES
ncbi:MAG TPA: MBL fold metallo-hydrolase [Patescibacteria group bacterium]|nr:MBL fold metallo-hydrolase [Patescibacteria group bacterium]